MALQPLKYFHPRSWSQHVHDFATVSPLLAAVIAPLSVLLDIPALSEKWYMKSGVPQPDPLASLVLSAIGLAFNILANGLLIMRFSMTGNNWRVATYISILCWGVKVFVALANLITFGVLTRNQPAFSYAEGFWCACVSCGLSGVILLLLCLHWWYEIHERGSSRKINQNVRISGRHFMLQTTLFIVWVGIGALVFSRIENWTYLQGIYFVIVCFLTVGFGDLLPVTTASRILLFPFALLGIALLGTILEMLVRFFSSRSAQRKAKARQMFEKQRQHEEDQKHDPTDLAREIEFLERINERQDVVDQMSELAFSFGGFLIFWFVGSVIFWAIEDWTYGNSMYFCYVFFLSIGFGDSVPITPGGRVIFIIYSLLAVPVMASFAVQAVTSVVTKFSSYRLDARKAAAGVETMSARNEERVISHAEFVERFHKRWESRKQRVSSEAAKEAIEEEETDEAAEREELVRRMIDLAVELEMHSRRLLVAHLPNGSKAQVVLKADRNVQLRDVRALRRAAESDKKSDGRAAYGAQQTGAEPAQTMDAPALDGHDADGPSGTAEHGGAREGGLTHADGDAGQDDEPDDHEDTDPDLVSRPLDDDATMEEVRRYRESFAAFLVAGSRLRGLEGHEKYMLERRKVHERMESERKDHAGKPASGEGEDSTL